MSLEVRENGFIDRGSLSITCFPSACSPVSILFSGNYHLCSPLVCQSISTLQTHWIHWLNLVLLWTAENTCWLTSSHSFLTCCLPLIGRLAPHLRLVLSSHYFLLLLITRTSFIIIVTHWAALVPHWLLPRQVGQALVLSRSYVIIAYSTRYSSTGFELCIGCISISICSSNVIAVARVACRI